MKAFVRGRTSWHLLFAFSGALVLSLCTEAAAQSVARATLRLAPVRGGSKVRLIYGKRSAVLNLEDTDVLPGDEPHRYKVLLTAKKGGTLYLLARVCSHSPISDPNAPCGGDNPCALLWIKSDERLKENEVKGRIYASCSFSYYPTGPLRFKGNGLRVAYREGVDYGDEYELSYDNGHPERGITLKKLGSFGGELKRLN